MFSVSSNLWQDKVEPCAKKDKGRYHWRSILEFWCASASVEFYSKRIGPLIVFEHFKVNSHWMGTCGQRQATHSEHLLGLLWGGKKKKAMKCCKLGKRMKTDENLNLVQQLHFIHAASCCYFGTWYLNNQSDLNRTRRQAKRVEKQEWEGQREHVERGSVSSARRGALGSETGPAPPLLHIKCWGGGKASSCTWVFTDRGGCALHSLKQRA